MVRKKINVVIERGVDGTYSAFIADNNCKFGCIGEGKNVEETKTDFLQPHQRRQSASYRISAAYRGPQKGTLQAGKQDLRGKQSCSPQRTPRRSRQAQGKEEEQ